MQVIAFAQSVANLRRVALHLVDATDGITPETGEVGGQPQVYLNSGAWANTGGVLVAIGNGAYYVELTLAECSTVGVGLVRYKSANTAEAQVAFDVTLTAANLTTLLAIQDIQTTLITDIQDRLPDALTANGLIKADTLRISGTLQTAGDLVVLLNAIDDFLDTEIAAILALLDTEIAAILAAVDTEVAAILAAVDTEVAAIKAVTDLFVAVQAEPTGVPAANATPLTKLGYLYASLRNKVTVTATKKQFFDDADAALWEKDLSDDGVTYTETEGNAP